MLPYNITTNFLTSYLPPALVSTAADMPLLQKVIVAGTCLVGIYALYQGPGKVYRLIENLKARHTVCRDSVTIFRNMMSIAVPIRACYEIGLFNYIAPREPALFAALACAFIYSLGEIQNEKEQQRARSRPAPLLLSAIPTPIAAPPVTTPPVTTPPVTTPPVTTLSAATPSAATTVMPQPIGLPLQEQLELLQREEAKLRRKIIKWEEKLQPSSAASNSGTPRSSCSYDGPSVGTAAAAVLSQHVDVDMTLTLLNQHITRKVTDIKAELIQNQNRQAHLKHLLDLPPLDADTLEVSLSESRRRVTITSHTNTKFLYK